MVNLCLKSYTFCLYFILYLHVVDPDPYWKYGSGLTKLDTDPKRIWIHNTGFKLSHHKINPRPEIPMIATRLSTECSKCTVPVLR